MLAGVVEGSANGARELRGRADHFDRAPEPARVDLAGRHQHREEQAGGACRHAGARSRRGAGEARPLARLAAVRLVLPQRLAVVRVVTTAADCVAIAPRRPRPRRAWRTPTVGASQRLTVRARPSAG
jgi:hypothetical protein